ncbi:hypothetical protein AERO9AM_10992 [Aeromicrobium sp. 9AM]|nr:hypothetical protein AERO9AM_10992 [Aeromicrobium sp. 9AM]
MRLTGISVAASPGPRYAGHIRRIGFVSQLVLLN